MTNLTDVDKAKISAETASNNRKKAQEKDEKGKLKLDPQSVILRAMKQDGVGLNPSEVWSLVELIFRMDDDLNKANQLAMDE